MAFSLVASWAFTVLWCLNTLGNLASRSRVERALMTPATILLALSFAVVALS